jgi:prepilin-type N-terminal cleavage/methylation domain-containing protein
MRGVPFDARGFSLIELVVVVIAIGLLAGFALDRLLPLIGRAQRVAFQQVQSELQSAMLLEAAVRITRGESATLGELAGTNPMALLLKAPQNYAGAMDEPRAETVPGHTWYYDDTRQRLVYRVGKYTRFEPLEGPPDRVEFRVSFVYRDRDGDGVYQPGHDGFDGLRLDPVHAYRWPD